MFQRKTSNITMSKSSCGQIVSIPTTEWTALRDVYRRDWPKNAYSYNALENYIQWSRKDPDLCKREVRIWSIDNNWREHGIYILEDKINHGHMIRADICSTEHTALFQQALHCTNFKSSSEFLFRERTCAFVKQHLENFGYKINLNMCFPAQLYMLSKSDCRKLEVRPRADFIIKPLTLNDVKEVDDFWPYKSAGSPYIISRNIKYNLSMGAYHPESGELCAWVIHSELGTLGLLCVKNNYRRRGLAEDLVVRICRTLAEQDCDASAHIEDTNEASTRLFKKLGFRPIEYNYWFIRADHEIASKASVAPVAGLYGQTMKNG
ncbi:PREDICTED: uncharacterized protein LOC108971467 [Bactrocera latifrons]|uniref:uncharacterized protein LOC108971467 n=1 Tax=Bactrocera latifrons TaxID=174628 RepID=UPI0008DCE73C|nr:PREDICTED: uncharacterized protein LOC108971467 [Bactrocera latifrons]